MKKHLDIAVASGKGGTGKTTISTSLALALARRGEAVAYVDCDVEEPNGHLFLKPDGLESRPVEVPVPAVDESRCTYCGACGRACRYSAMLVLPKTVVTFPKLCHGCGGCLLACPEGAIREERRAIGVVETVSAGALVFVQGRLDVGEAMSPPVIRAVRDAAPRDMTCILDAPPGTSCPVIESVKGADAVLLVTEPTPFGLNDLELAVGMVRELGLPFGVAVNRSDIGDRSVFEYCKREGIPVLLELPDDRAIARAYSEGKPLLDARPDLEPVLLEMAAKLRKLAEAGPVASAGPALLQDPVVVPSGPAPCEIANPGEAERVPELVVVSGKGGTGKTSIVASFFALAGDAALADCDVDAADLHLVLDPEVEGRFPFSGGSIAVVDEAHCTACGACAALCRFDAIRPPEGGVYRVDPVSCEGCGVCVDHCPEDAVALVPRLNGQWFVSRTRHGPMVHARLGIAEENSGKLVTLVRKEGRCAAAAAGRALLICDGSPGIGCPVIASVTGARLALLVAEPTLSGLHDLERVAELTVQLGVPAAVCVNKCDINPEIAERIEIMAAARGIEVLGRVRYDEEVTRAQVRRLSVVEHGAGPAADDIRSLWRKVRDVLE